MQRNSVPCGHVGLAFGPSKRLHDHLKPCFLRWTFMKTEAGAHTPSLGVGEGGARIADGSVLFIISVPEQFYSAQGCAFACWCQGCPSFALLCSVAKEKKTSLPFGKANLRRRRRLVIWVAVGIWLNWRTEDCDQGGKRWLCGEGFGDAIQDSALDSHLHRGCCFTVHW